jgi:hypothetical protein
LFSPYQRRIPRKQILCASSTVSQGLLPISLRLTPMLSMNYNNYPVRFTVFLLLALASSGCNRTTTKATANGTNSMGQPVSISAADTDAAEPAMATAADGSVYVAWVNHRPDGQADVMIARLSSDGKLQGSPARVNTQPGIATAWRGDQPTLAIAPDKTVFVGWTGRVESNAGHATNIYLSASRDNGQTFKNPVTVNDDLKVVDHGLHSLAIGKDGRIYLAWLDDRNAKPMEIPAETKKTKAHHMESNRELFMASSKDGGRSFSANQRVATDVCPCCKTALAVSADGRVYLGWRQVLPGDLRHIAVASSSDQGNTFSAPKIVSDDQWVLTGCPVSGPTLAVAADGALIVLWYSGGKNGQTGLYWSESKDQGASFGTRVLVASGSTRGTPVLLSDGSYLGAVWEGSVNSSTQVMTTRLTPDAHTNQIGIADGELPAAVQTSNGLMIAYIGKTDQQHGIWIVTTPRPGSGLN